MANPEEPDSQEVFDEKVTTALKEAKNNSEGKLEFPEDTPKEVVHAAKSEQRRRHTQAEYTKSKQAQAVLEAEKTELLKQVGGIPKLELTPVQKEELEGLKFSSPDSWRDKLNNYETEAHTKHTNEVNKRLQEVSVNGTKTAELERRQQVLQDFEAANQGFVINDDVIANDVPPRITKRLEDGVITFEDFLKESYNYIKASKVISIGGNTLNQPDLGQAGGSDTPSEDAVRHESQKSYLTEVY